MERLLLHPALAIGAVALLVLGAVLSAWAKRVRADMEAEAARQGSGHDMAGKTWDMILSQNSPSHAAVDRHRHR